ncbi:hypothetical protein HBI92_144360 [Parastagonospora nodorum]|nr:hypothetical protein HBI92_144360 [Parastagonospora nodorum]
MHLRISAQKNGLPVYNDRVRIDSRIIACRTQGERPGWRYVLPIHHYQLPRRDVGSLAIELRKVGEDHSSSTRQLYTDSATMRFIFGPNVQPMDCYPESRYDHKDGLFFTTVEYDCSDWGILEGQAIFESNLSPASGPLAINYTSEISGRNVENEGLLRILVRNSVPRNYQCM